jgi:hypothetical protein
MAYRRTLSVEFEGGKAAKRLKRAGAKIEVGMGTITRAMTSRAVAGARRRGASLGGVHAHVLPGVRAQANNIKLDPRSQPAIFGAVFGGGQRPTTQQFPPWRGSGREAGYMIYPDLRAQEREIDRLVVSLIDKAL